MIPRVVPPLTDLTVLVTRPAVQCAALCAEIERYGGSAIAFPAVEIEPVAVQAKVASADYDLVVFVSVNAVEHGWLGIGVMVLGDLLVHGRDGLHQVVAQVWDEHIANGQPGQHEQAERCADHPCDCVPSI